VPDRMPRASDPHPPKRRPQQKQNADGTVQAGELHVQR
jgi:hypothetical protein